MCQCTKANKRKLRCKILPGTIVFALVAVTAFLTTGTRLTRQEKCLPSQEIAFEGVVTHAGHASPGDRTAARFQTIRLTDGTPAVLWMKYPARKGDYVSGLATFEIGESSRNPGGFSKRMWLWSKGVAWTGCPRLVKVTEMEGQLLWILRLPDRVRDHVRQHLASLWTSANGPLLLSLSVGDTSLLTDGQSYKLQSAGLMHLTSVSGTHLMFLMNPIFIATDRARISRRLKQWITLPVLLMPGVLSGWKSGITRASLVSIAMRLDIPMKKRRNPFNTLFLVGSLMLIVQPYALYGLSFWMSFSAAIAISFSVKTMKSAAKNDMHELTKSGKMRFRVCKYFESTIVFSSMAQLVILPYQLMSAPGIHLLAPIINVIAIPLAAYMTAATYPIIAVLSVLPAGTRAAHVATTVFAALLSPAAHAFEWLAGCVAKTAFAFLPLKWCLPILLVIILAYVSTSQASRFLREHRRIVTAIAASSLVIVSAAVFWINHGWRIVFLDVGQGDATLFISPSGYTVLLDGGDKGHGYRTIIPAARMYAVTTIDLAIVSHGHCDHAAGIAELLEVGLVKHLCLPPERASDLVPHIISRVHDKEDMTDHLVSIAKSARVPVSYLQAGECLACGDFSMDVLHPQGPICARDLNEDSLVLRIDAGGLVLLMTGDLTEAGERSLLASGRECKADILHVAHHGADKSSTQVFLQATEPDVAIISVAKKNRYGHPHTDALARLHQECPIILRTDQSGAVFLNIRRGKSTMNTWIEP